MPWDATDTTDMEERVLHFARYVRDGEDFSVIEAVESLLGREAAILRTVLLLMNLEVLQRKRIGEAHVYRYEPSEASMQLVKVQRLHAHASALAKQRPLRTARLRNYDATRC